MPGNTFTMADLKQLKKDFAKDRRMQKRGIEPRTMHEAEIRAADHMADEMLALDDKRILGELRKAAQKAQQKNARKNCR